MTASINVIDKVTQENTANANSAADSSRDLSQAAEDLLGLVDELAEVMS